MKLSHSPDEAESLPLDLGIFLTAADRVRDAKQTGRSEPSSILCDSTAPMPYAELSHAKMSGRLGS